MTRRIGIALFCAITFAGALFDLPACAAQLRSPWDGLRVAATHATYACPAPPAFSKTLQVEGYYTDNKYSVTDRKRLAAFNEATAGPTHLGQYASGAADAWLRTGSREAARCVYSLLAKAAHADAWDAEMPDNNGVYLQNWTLSGTAVAYLKVRGRGVGTPQQDAEIQRWFGRLAGQVRSYFDRQRSRLGSDAWNNHMYWAGLAVMAEGIADNDTDAFLWGVAAYRMGLFAIEPDGALDAEVARGQKALHYQLYALGGLVMMAELGEANGIRMYAAQNGAIHRLVRFDVTAMVDPGMIARRAGVAQEDSRPYSGNEIGWAVPYVKRFPNAKLSALLAKAPWVSFWQWGGDPAPGGPSPDPGAGRNALRQSVRKMMATRFPDRSAASAFLGEWCAEGNNRWHSTIRNAGDYLLLHNESGGISLARTHAQKIEAMDWAVTGTLLADRRRIDWTNGTFWARCPALARR